MSTLSIAIAAVLLATALGAPLSGPSISVNVTKNVQHGDYVHVTFGGEKACTQRVPARRARYGLTFCP